MSAPVFLCAEASGAAVGDVLRLGGAEARHAKVARLAPGESVDLVDGAGTRARCVVASATESAVDATVVAIEVEVDPVLVIVQALAKGGRDEAAVETATELGATRFVPWEAARSVVEWRGDKATRGRERWGAVALAAAKQSRRALVPVVEPAVGTRALVDAVRGAVADGALVVILDPDAGASLLDVLARATREAVLWFVVGPEGGIAPEETEALVAAGAVRARLGSRILRASSAGPAALAAVLAVRDRES